MTKPSTQLQLMTARKEIAQLRQEIWAAKGFTIQQCMDMAMIALNKEFGFGPDRNVRFERAFREVFTEYADLCVEDGKDDAEIAYTKDVVDRALRAARGEIEPFDERYRLEKLYFKDSREKWKEGG